jgi:hypothetical protein
MLTFAKVTNTKTTEIGTNIEKLGHIKNIKFAFCDIFSEICFVILLLFSQICRFSKKKF